MSRPAPLAAWKSLAVRSTAAVVGLALLGGSAVARDEPPTVDRSGRKQVGLASFYSRGEAGKPMASGAPLDPDKMTAASRTLPLGTQARVVNVETGQAADVTVTDRGPYVGDRVVDVTPKAAERLGIKEAGVAKVEVRPLQDPPPTPRK